MMQSQINFESLVESQLGSSKLIKLNFIKAEQEDDNESDGQMDIPDENPSEVSGMQSVNLQ